MNNRYYLKLGDLFSGSLAASTTVETRVVNLPEVPRRIDFAIFFPAGRQSG